MTEPIAWRKASRCESRACVEVAVLEHVVLLRDSKTVDGPVLTLAPAEWDAFCAGVRRGEFDAPR